MVKCNVVHPGDIIGKVQVIRQLDDYIVPGNGAHKAMFECKCLVCGTVFNGMYVSICRAHSFSKGCGKCNSFILQPSGIGKTPLGKVLKFDPERYSDLKERKWYLDSRGYAASSKPTPVQMHRYILGITDKNVCVDHKNHDTCDNRLDNLRLCSTAQNTKNKLTISKFKYKNLYVMRQKSLYIQISCEGVFFTIYNNWKQDDPSDIESAGYASLVANKLLFKEFANVDAYKDIDYSLVKDKEQIEQKVRDTIRKTCIKHNIDPSIYLGA